MDRAVVEVGPHVAAQPDVGGLQRGGATSGMAGPGRPPLVGPVLEADAALTKEIGAALGEECVLKLNRGGLLGEGLAALGPVVQPPPDLVADPAGASAGALANPRRGHQRSMGWRCCQRRGRGRLPGGRRGGALMVSRAARGRWAAWPQWSGPMSWRAAAA